MSAAPRVGPSWLDEVRDVPVADIAAELGLTVRRGSPPTLSPCPSCGLTRRGSSDPRGPAGLSRNGMGWKCHRCDVSGDGLTLAALILAGRPLAPGAAEWREIRAWYAERRWCSPDPGTTGGQGPRPTLAPRPIPVVPPPEPTPTRPDAAEVAAFWRDCWPVRCDDAVAAWLRDVRGFDVAEIEWRDLARAVPLDDVDTTPEMADAPTPSRRPAAVPRWARFKGRPWPVSGHRVVVRMFGATGRVESIHARSVDPKCPKGDKAAAAAGAELRGLVMADDLGRAMLEAGGAPAWWPPGKPLDVVIAEGEPDFLTDALAWGAPAVPCVAGVAVLGVVAGSWTADLAARIPSGARVAVRPHDDDAGRKYTDRIVETLAERCQPFIRQRSGSDGR